MNSPINDLLDEIELKPCPFCGRQAVIVSHPGTNWDAKADKSVNVGALHRLWYVGCSYSFFEGLDAGTVCEITPAAKWFAKLDKAIALWNSQNS